LKIGTTYGNKIPNRIYLKCYPQQFTIAFVWSILFRIFGTTSLALIRYFNVICNGLTVLAIYLICTELSKKYNANKILGVLLIATFITLPLLSTFIYGDLSCIAFSLLAVYFIIKYTRCQKQRYALISAIFLSISYMIRVNTLIFLIAIFIYLILDIIESEKKIEIIVKKALIIAGLIIIVVVPTTIVKNYYLKKYDLNKEKSFPITGWIYMGMQEGYASPGWYNGEVAKFAFEDLEFANYAYDIAIEYRANYFLENPEDMFEFYKLKLASMWAENTYSAIHYNLSRNFDKGDETNLKEIDEKLESFELGISIYQKALILIIFGKSIFVVWRSRKDISKEVILLLTIFIGGFLFQTIWEAKSRYIIPYIIVLIPIATILINKRKKENKNEFTKQANSN